MAVIFDCDGVMFDSRQANRNFYNHILARFGHSPMAEEDVAYVHMHTADESIRHVFRDSPHLEEALRYRWEVDYAPFILDMVMEPWLREVLSCLGLSTGLAVATNRSNTIEWVLERHGLTGIFDVVVSSLDVARPKPHPDPLIKVLDHYGIDAGNALYVGDSPVDAETAASAGVPFVAYKDERLEADHHARDLWEVARIALR
ncbi:MAG: HAD family hydrolase [Deltaproteobacteria bacterium]|nr:HAD family hydrolase [Deltaproteobacteria bacterium]